MLTKDKYDPETQFYCYICERIKNRTEGSILFRIHPSQWTACEKCNSVIDSLRTLSPGEEHPVIENGVWKMGTE